MASLFYSSPRARFSDSNGNPLAMGRVSFYYPGTTTLKQIYTDKTEATPAQNPQPLDAEGYVRDGGVWLGQGEYDILLEASDGGGGYITEWSIPNVMGADETPSGSVGDIAYVRTVADLQNISAGSVGGAYVFGYYTENDGGQGWFLWDGASTDAEDGGAVIAPTGNPAQGRWIRQFGDEVTAWQFGAMGTAPSVVDANLAKMMFFADGDKRKKVVIQSDTYSISSLLALSGDLDLELQEGVLFNGTGGITLSPRNLIIDGQTAIVSDDVDLTISPTNKIDCYADWWGAQWGVKSAGNYPLDLIFNGSYQLSPTNSSSHNYWKFTEGSVVNVINTPYTTSIKGYKADDNWNDIFDGAYGDLQLVDQRSISVNHFKNCLLDSIGYGLILNLVTLGATKSGVLLWGGYKVYNSVPLYTAPATNFKINSKILEGSKFNFNNFCWVGNIINSAMDYIIIPSSPAYPIVDNGVINAQWLGAGMNVSNDNFTCLDSAFEMAQGKEVNGNGASIGIFESAGDLEFYRNDINFIFNLKNIKFYFSSLGLASNLSFRNTSKLTDVQFTSASNQDLNQLNFGIQSDLIAGRIVNITLNNVTTLLIGGSVSVAYCNPVILNSNINANNITLGVGRYKGSQFNENGSSSTIQLIQDQNNQNSCWIDGCTIYGRLDAYIQNDFYCQSSEIISDIEAIRLNIPAWATAHKNILIKDNRFICSGVVDTYKSVVGSTAGGHINCRVAENFVINYLESGTELNTISEATLTSFGSDTITIDGSSLILPRVNNSGAKEVYKASSTQIYNGFFSEWALGNISSIVNGDFDLLHNYIGRTSSSDYTGKFVIFISVNDFDSFGR